MALLIKLVRHGESEANTGAVNAQVTGDAHVALSAKGKEQARAIGATLGAEFLNGALVYVSPYMRTRQTLAGILEATAAKTVRVLEDPRLREVEHGYEDVATQEELRKTHGWFFYRFRGGESPADCYDRTSSFLESMMRQIERKTAERVLIVTHGLTIRCFVTRFMRLKVEDFDEMANPKNCDIVTIAEHQTLESCTWRSGRWGVHGLARRPPE